MADLHLTANRQFVQVPKLICSSAEQRELTLPESPRLVCACGAASRVFCFGTVANGCSPRPMLLAEPLHLCCRADSHLLRCQLFIAFVIPACCNVWTQGSQAGAPAWPAADADRAACVVQGPGMYWGWPLMGVSTAAGLAQPPGLEVRAKRHLRGRLLVLGVPLLSQGWPAGDWRVACTAMTQCWRRSFVVLPAGKCLSALHTTQALPQREALLLARECHTYNTSQSDSSRLGVDPMAQQFSLGPGAGM